MIPPAPLPVWWDGRLMDAREAMVPAASQGLLWGRGLFETLRVRDGQALCLSRHIDRLRLSAPRLGLLPPSESDLRHAVGTVLSKAPSGPLRLRITLTGPDKPGLSLDPDHPEPGQLLIQPTPLPELSKTGAVLLTVPWRRNEFGALSGIKSTAYAENPVALAWARQRGGTEALFLNTAGDLCEGATSNLFLVQAGTVLTPSLSSGCLPGITRSLVLELCAQRGIPISEKALFPSSAADADEIFLTNTLRGIQPVRTCGQRRLPEPGSDSLTEKLSDALTNLLLALPDP